MAPLTPLQLDYDGSKDIKKVRLKPSESCVVQFPRPVCRCDHHQPLVSASQHTFELEEELHLHPAHCLVLPGFPLREQGVDLVDEDYCRLDRTRNIV